MKLLIVVLALLGLACGGGSTATGPSTIPAVPPFAFHGATQAEELEATATWERMAACVGLDPEAARLVPFAVLEAQAMYCGTVLAAGCTAPAPPSIEVRREWFSPATCAPGYAPNDCHAMQTEVLHLALLLHHEDWGYGNAAWERCR